MKGIIIIYFNDVMVKTNFACVCVSLIILYKTNI